MSEEKIVVDLDGEYGDSSRLIALARDLAKKRHLDHRILAERMMSGDHEHMISVFEYHFADAVILKGKPRLG